MNINNQAVIMNINNQVSDRFQWGDWSAWKGTYKKRGVLMVLQF